MAVRTYDMPGTCIISTAQVSCALLSCTRACGTLVGYTHGPMGTGRPNVFVYTRYVAEVCNQMFVQERF